MPHPPAKGFRSRSGIFKGRCMNCQNLREQQNIHNPKDCNCDVQHGFCGDGERLWGSMWLPCRISDSALHNLANSPSILESQFEWLLRGLLKRSQELAFRGAWLLDQQTRTTTTSWINPVRLLTALTTSVRNIIISHILKTILTTPLPYWQKICSQNTP